MIYGEEREEQRKRSNEGVREERERDGEEKGRGREW